ncbi:MAG: flippase-like domain-containing protein [Leadbetterella sp.]|nr:flippase-like domain-containing protein [Leadbetterella sp.]
MKLVFLVAVFVLLYRQITNLTLSKSLLLQIIHTLKGNLAYFLAAIALLFLNYFFEILKWNLLTKQVQARTFRQSTIDVLKGLRAGLFTPLMLGDFLGRSVGFRKENRTEVMALNFFNSVCQTYVTLLFGSAAILFWWIISDGRLHNLLIVPLLIFILVSILGFLFVFRLKISWQFLERINFIKPYLQTSVLGLNISNKFRVGILGLSIARTLVYNVQFWLFYVSLGIHLPILILFIGVNLMLLVKTVGGGLNIFGDLTLREFISINFFGLYHIEGSLILIATFVVWFFNIFLPVLIGFFIKPKE